MKRRVMPPQGPALIAANSFPAPLRLRSYQGMNDVLKSIKPAVKRLDSIDVVILEAIKIRPGQAAYQILESLPAIRTKSIYHAGLERIATKHFL